MKCRYCKKKFEKLENYCPNCGRELNSKDRKKTWPYFLVIGITLIEFILVFMSIKSLMNFFGNYEIQNLRESKFIEEVKKLGCNVIDVTESNTNNSVVDYYITDSQTCPYLISYTKFKDTNTQENFYNQLINQADNVEGYRTYSSISFNNYKEYNITTQDEYRAALYNGKTTIYIQSKIKNKENLINFKKALGFDFKMDWSFSTYIIAYIIMINIMVIVSWWLINTKMGRQGWICLIPVYNIICLCEDVLGKKSYAWFFLIPYANLVFTIILLVNLAKVFGKSEVYQILSIFFSSITIPLIAFDNSTYTRPEKNNSLMNNNKEHYVVTNDNHIEIKTQTIVEEESPKKDNIFLIIIKWILTFFSLFMTLGSYLLVVEDKEYENILPGIIFFILAIMACPAVTEHTKRFKLYTKFKSLIVFILIVLIIFIYGTI